MIDWWEWELEIPIEYRYVYDAEVTRVVDGDTVQMKVFKTLDFGFRIKMHSEFEPRFRILDLDTFEKYGVKKTSQEYKRGVEASVFATGLLPVGTEVKIRTHKDKTGKYGRYLVEIRLSDGRNFAAVMIKEGHDKTRSA